MMMDNCDQKTGRLIIAEINFAKTCCPRCRCSRCSKKMFLCNYVAITMNYGNAGIRALRLKFAMTNIVRCSQIEWDCLHTQAFDLASQHLLFGFLLHFYEGKSRLIKCIRTDCQAIDGPPPVAHMARHKIFNPG